MPDLIAAIDQEILNKVVDAETRVVDWNQSTSVHIAPFLISVAVDVKLPHCAVKLVPPNIFHFDHLDLHYTLDGSFTVRLNDILPHPCFRVCFLFWCTPERCLNWPDITVPFSSTGDVTVVADFKVDIHLDSNTNQWLLDIIPASVPHMDLSAQAVALFVTIEYSVMMALNFVPFIGPFLSAAAASIMGVFNVVALTGALDGLLRPFLNNLRFNLIKQDKVVTLQKAEPPGPYPAVTMSIDGLTSDIEQTDETELVLTGTLSFP